LGRFFLILIIFQCSLFSQTLEETHKLIQKDPFKAKGYIELAMRKYAFNPELYLLRAKHKLFESTGTLNDILKDVNISLKYGPKDPYAHAFRAYVLIRMLATKKSPEISREILKSTKSAYDLNPKHLSFAINYMYALLRSGNTEDTWKVLEPLLKVKENKENYYLQTLYVTYLNLTGKPIKALELIPKIKKAENKYDYLSLEDKIFKKDFVHIKAMFPKAMTLEDAMKRGHLPNYIKLFDHTLKSMPMHKMGWEYIILYANSLKSQGDYTKAINVAKNMIKLGFKGDGLYKANMLIARLYAQLKMYDYAIPYFKKAISQTKGHKKLLAQIECYFSLLKNGQPKEAQSLRTESLKEFNTIKKLNHSFDEALSIATSQYNKWARAYTNAPRLEGYHYFLSHLWYNTATIIRLYKPNNILDKHHEKKQYELFVENAYEEAHVWFIFNDEEKFKKLVDEAKRFFPYDVRHIYFEALFAFKKGEKEEALKVINSFLEKSPSDTDALKLKTMILLDKKAYGEALLTIEKMVAKKEKAYLRFIVQIAQGQIESSIAEIEKLLKQDLEDERLIVLFHSLKKFESEKASLEFLNKFKPSFHDHNYLAYLNKAVGKLNEAKLFKPLKQRVYLRPRTYLYQGLLAMKKGKTAEAKKYFNNCLHPYTVDHPEHQLAKVFLEKL